MKITILFLTCAALCLAQDAKVAAPIVAPPAPALKDFATDKKNEAYMKALAVQNAQILVAKAKEDGETKMAAAMKEAQEHLTAATTEFQKFAADQRVEQKVSPDCNLFFTEKWVPQWSCPPDVKK